MPKTAQKDASVATVKKQGAVMKHIKKYWQWYAMMLIPVVYYIVFRYIPMFGNIIAFRRYRAGVSSRWTLVASSMALKTPSLIHLSFMG